MFWTKPSSRHTVSELNCMCTRNMLTILKQRTVATHQKQSE